MSRRGMHPLLMGLDKPKREPIEKKQVELTGYESAQRKRFLKAEEAALAENFGPNWRDLLAEQLGGEALDG